MIQLAVVLGNSVGNRDLGDMAKIIQAKRPRRLAVILARDEVSKVLESLHRRNSYPACPSTVDRQSRASMGTPDTNFFARRAPTCLKLSLTIVADEEGAVGAKGLSKESGLHVVKLPGSTSFEFQLVPGGCSCTLLARDAKAGAPFVKLEETALPGLERALKLLGNRADRFSFSAVWLLDPDEHLPAVRTPLKTLLRRVRGNQLENGRGYVVGRPV